MDGIARSRLERSTASADRLSILVVLFLMGLIFPLAINLGPARLSPYRIVLLVTLIPCVIRWLLGGAGPKRMADVGIILIGVWGTVSWVVLHGVSVAIESAGIHIIETLGAYFLGRSLIRSPEAFRRMAVLLFWIVVGLLPFLIYETLTGRSMILEFITKLGPTYPPHHEQPRLGLERAQGPFQHPILLGVFCGSAVSVAYYVLAHGRRLVNRAQRVLLTVLAASCALSSGPLAGIAVQLLMIGWDRTFEHYRNRWWGLGGLFFLGYVVVDLISNRTPLIVLMSYLTLNPRTALGRIEILEFGWLNVLKYPLFGNVLGEWERPEWVVSSSVDMFWLQRAMAHGMPMGALYLLAFFVIFVAVARRKLSDPRIRDYRMGFLGSMLGLFVAGWAVHFWNEPYVLLMFLMGSGVWLLDHKETPPPPAPTPERTRPRAVLS